MLQLVDKLKGKRNELGWFADILYCPKISKDEYTIDFCIAISHGLL